MKTLILTRHAKSDWSSPLQKDYDRPLNKRGLNDAPMMGSRLAQREIKVDAILSSTAQRAEQTAKLIADAIQYDLQKIDWYEKLYHASPHTIEEVILEANDNADTILIVCHNNGITDFANSLSTPVTHDMPTCAMMAFRIDATRWSDFCLAKKQLLFYDFPKLDD